MDFSLDSVGLERLAEALSRHLGPILKVEVNGNVMDAVHDSLAKAAPAAMDTSTAQMLLAAIERNTRREAFAQGWDAATKHGATFMPDARLHQGRSFFHATMADLRQPAIDGYVVQFLPKETAPTG